MSLDERHHGRSEPLDTRQARLDRSIEPTIDLDGVRAQAAAAAARRKSGAASKKSPRRPSSRTTCTASSRATRRSGLDPVGRRNFLKLMSASMALAGVTACTVQPRGADRSVRPPARRRNPRQAAVLRHRDDARRRRHRACSSKATKAGRPRSKAIPIIPPARARPICSRRARCSRSTIRIARRRSLQLGEIRPWSAVIAAIRGGLSAQAASKGAGLRILTETVASPTLAAQIQQVLAQHPEREVDSVGAGQSRQRARRRPHGVRPVRRAGLRPDQGRRHPVARRRLPVVGRRAQPALHARSSRRAAASKRAPTISTASTSSKPITRVTGGRADHRLPLKSSQIEAFARAVAAGAGVSGVSGTAPAGTEAFAAAVAKDLVGITRAAPS